MFQVMLKQILSISVDNFLVQSFTKKRPKTKDPASPVPSSDESESDIEGEFSAGIGVDCRNVQNDKLECQTTSAKLKGPKGITMIGSDAI